MANQRNDNPIRPQLEVQKHLKGVDYPAHKRDLIKHARDQDAPEEVLSLLEAMADKEYDNPAEVTKEVSKGS